MKSMRHIVIASACLFILITGSSCNVFRNMFGGPKNGCPSNGKNIGAERILSGEKVPKAKKFKA